MIAAVYILVLVCRYSYCIVVVSQPARAAPDKRKRFEVSSDEEEERRTPEVAESHSVEQEKFIGEFFDFH